MKRRAIILSMLSLLVIAGCSGAVSGQVSSKSGQQPVPNATVVMGDQQAVTDTGGNFTIDKVSTGAATVAVQAEGFGPYEGTLDVQRGDNTLNVVLEDGTVKVMLKENAEVREPIKKATVTLADERVSVKQGASFEAAGIPVGEQKLVVTSPGHAPSESTVTVSPGMNEATITLDLTPVETYTRYYQAYRFNRLHEAYRFVHDDVKKHDSYKQFAKEMGDGSDTLGIKFFDPKSMKTYEDIVAIDRATRYQYGLGSYTDNRTQHWQQIEGRWYIIYNWNL